MPKIPLKPAAKEIHHEELKTKPKKPTMSLDNITERDETIARFNEERLRRNDYGCVDFYVVLTFQSTEQRNEFLSQTKSKVVLGHYVDGEEFAGEIGYSVTPNELPPDKSKLNKLRTSMVDKAAIAKAAKR